MEDAHTAELNLTPPDNDTKTHPDRLSFFGVFDGHGGDKVALFAGENIHKIVFKQDSFKTGDYAQGLKDGFLATDRAILNGTQRDCSISFVCVRLRGSGVKRLAQMFRQSPQRTFYNYPSRSRNLC